MDFTADAGLVHASAAFRSISIPAARWRCWRIRLRQVRNRQRDAALLPKRGRIVNGSIMFRDPLGGGPVDIVKLDPDSEKMRQRCGARLAMIFQEPMTSLSPLHTVGDQVTEALRIHDGVSQEDAEAPRHGGFRAGRLPRPLRACSQPIRLSSRAAMRQRAMIAMALICRPALLIADEPTTRAGRVNHAGADPGADQGAADRNPDGRVC